MTWDRWRLEQNKSRPVGDAEMEETHSPDLNSDSTYIPGVTPNWGEVRAPRKKVSRRYHWLKKDPCFSPAIYHCGVARCGDRFLLGIRNAGHIRFARETIESQGWIWWERKQQFLCPNHRYLGRSMTPTRTKPPDGEICSECRWPLSCSIFRSELKRCDMLDWPEVVATGEDNAN